MITEIANRLYAVKVRLVGNPLRDLNSYVFAGKERSLLIDTGFNQSECLEDLRAGISGLGLDMDKTDILATHCHADHSGLIGAVVTEHSRVFMGARDKAILENRWSDKESYKKDFVRRFLSEGYPADKIEYAYQNNPAAKLAAMKPYAMTGVNDGDVIQAGDMALTAIDTPGHTPGHMCFYEPNEKIMVLGDHVLFDITPNITAWNSLPNALWHYLESLKKIKRYDVALPLPGHRERSRPMNERIDELFAHHDRRLAETLRVVAENPGISGYAVASRLTWSIRAKNWEDFPVAQKWFAVGEALSHLDYLVEAKKIRRTMHDGIAVYEA
jgi:glyoxylase-like metal-dependent hydrolase (beta-lactamase superfamily II)